MKKIFTLIIFSLISLFVFSQTQINETELLSKLLGTNKKAMVSQFVDLPDSHMFWSLYNEYEKKREVFGEKRFKLLVQYAENYESHSDTNLEGIIENSITLRNEGEKLLIIYFEKIKEQCGIKTASQFYFIQRFFQSSINADILGNLPIIDK